MLLSLLVLPGAGQFARGRRALGIALGSISCLLVLAAASVLARAIALHLPTDLLEWNAGSLPLALMQGLRAAMPALVPLLGLLLALWGWSTYDAYRR